MSKQKKNLLFTGCVLFTAFLLAACTQDDALPGDNDGSMPALALTTLQATDIDVSKAATRAVSTTDYPTANAIGFFVKADAANGYVACDNRKGEYNAARKLWLPTPDSIWLNSHDADIAVYAPYDAAHTTATTLNLAASLRPADGSKDIGCKHITANNKSKNLTVTLEHVYTRLALTVTRDANYKAEAVLSALSLKGDEVYESATYKPFETTPYTYSATTGLTPTVAEQTLNASTASATYDLLLIPTPLTGDITLTLTVDGKKMETIIDKTRFTGSKLEAGKQYNVNLALKPGKLEITSVSLVKWDALPEINGGQAEFNVAIGIDIGLDFVIAPGNLRAVKPAGSDAYEYSFAKGQGYYSGVLGEAYDPAGGDYFCWNTLSPGEIVKKDFMHIEWDDAFDPCRKIGTGEWYTPSSDQLSLIRKKGNVWGTYEMSGGLSKEGMYFGAMTAPSKTAQDNYLFLPAAGYRDKTGVITNDVGHLGCYWGTTRNFSASAENPFGLSFKSADNSAWTGTGMYTNSDTGMPVRCVRDK